MSAKGFSLHIGLNGVDAKHYQGWPGILNACENDAEVYRSIAEKSGYTKINVLLTKEATSRNLFDYFKVASKELQRGDTLFISYSGHGGAIPDLNGDETTDSMDETWCLYDRQVIDDELYSYYGMFAEGVRILIFSDSCHSGTVARGVPTVVDVDPGDKVNYMKSRLMPLGAIQRTYNANREMYNAVGAATALPSGIIPACVILFAACQDEEEAMEVWDNGMFTAKLKKVLQGKTLSYNQIFEDIKKGFYVKQHPQLSKYGNVVEYDFINEFPFSIRPETISAINIAVADPTRMEEKPVQLIVELNDPEAASGRDFYTPFPASRSAGQNGTSPEENRFFLTDTNSAPRKEWDKAYETFQENPAVKFAEPNIASPYLQPRQATRGTGTNDYLNNWPQPSASSTEFVWHLDEQHSQLKKASDFVKTTLGENAIVRIGHIDTGYLPDHPSKPQNLLTDLGVSFVSREFGVNKGIDKLNSGFPAEQDGHGCATLALLAGNNISANDSYGNYAGSFGAIPFAEIIPIRICETVFNLLNANDVAAGIDYAVDHGCDVITMSMAGYPTRRVAEAVNRAYEKGVIIVTAAGNNFTNGLGKLAPKAILFPARFERVIAATGTCYNDEPYDLEANAWYQSRSAGGEAMQGNWGPEKAMKKAVAAYTPNVAWATSNAAYRFYRSGGGTSSATPQVAATAALWVAYNRAALIAAGINKSWQKVEAARAAIFSSADKNYPAYKKYYGNGIIRAFDALTAFDFSTLGSLVETPKAKVGLTGLSGFFSGWKRSRGGDQLPDEKDDSLREMLSLEAMQVVYRDPKLMQFAEVISLESEDGTELFSNPKARKSFAQKIADSEYASDFLKTVMKNIASG